MASEKPEEGDKVSWEWNGSHPSGIVAEKKTEGEASVTSKRGNVIKKPASPSDPALALERSGNDVVKKQSELEVEEKQVKPENKKGAGSRAGTPAASKAGTKRKHDEEEEEKEGHEASEEAKENGTEEKAEPAKKGRGRPKAAPKANTTKGGDKKVTGAAKAAKEQKEAKENGDAPKKRPGRPPKDPNAAPAAKKQKKEPRQGTRKSSRINS